MKVMIVISGGRAPVETELPDGVITASGMSSVELADHFQPEIVRMAGSSVVRDLLAEAIAKIKGATSFPKEMSDG